MRQALAPLAAMKARFDFDIRQVIQTGGIAELQLFRRNAEGRSNVEEQAQQAPPATRVRGRSATLCVCLVALLAALQY